MDSVFMLVIVIEMSRMVLVGAQQASYKYDEVLENYHVNATPVAADQYPWIAKVVHSRTADFPFMCTASCVDTRLFITSARCLATIKVLFTTIIYQNTRFSVKAFILSSNHSKQWFDDIGIIVTYPQPDFNGAWETVDLINISRTLNKDNPFDWFEKLNYENQPVQHKVVAYATEKSVFQIKPAQLAIPLVEMDVVVGIEMCEVIFKLPGAFHVPCYYHCNLKEFNKQLLKCRKFVGSDGAAIINTNTNVLLGIATWGIKANTPNIELPTGFAVPNSELFKEDLECAKVVRDDTTKDTPLGYLQLLCGKP